MSHNNTEYEHSCGGVALVHQTPLRHPSPQLIGDNQAPSWMSPVFNHNNDHLAHETQQPSPIIIGGGEDHQNFPSERPNVSAAAAAAARLPETPPQQGQEQQEKQQPTQEREEKHGREPTYVQRIREMLEYVEKEGLTHIVSWQPHGRAFRIHKKQEFINQIMPKHFNAKFHSFVRWLRAWGFERITEGKDRDAYFHRFFVRGVAELCQNMSREQMFTAMVGWLPPGSAPNFYTPPSGGPFSGSRSSSTQAATTLALAENPKRLRGRTIEDIRDMLQDAEEEGNGDIVSWCAHGRAFMVHDKIRFEATIMPRYFNTTNYYNFSNTLRLWGFKKLKKNIDKGAYFHRLFVRGDSSLSRHRSRELMRDAMNDWPPPQGEPDLHMPDFIGPNSANAQRLLHNNAPTRYSLSGRMTQKYAATTDGHVGNPLQPTPLQTTNNGQPAASHSQYEGGGGSVVVNVNNNEYPLHALHNHDTTFRHCNTNNNNDMPHQYDYPDDTPARFKGRKKGDRTYVMRIHEMLEDADREGNYHIASWLPHGRAFKIHLEDEFVEKILPRYFKAKFGSFRRWLTAWGFVRVTEGKDRGSWHHRYFVRGATELCRNMQREEMSKAMEAWPLAPDFYSVRAPDASCGKPGSQQIVSGIKTVAEPKKLRGKVLDDLRRMLQDAEEEGNGHILSWLPGNRTFMIYRKDDFASKILPRYFKTNTIYHFSDTIRLWGFVRLKQGPEKGAFHHKLFVRGQPWLTRGLSRKLMKNAMSDWTGVPTNPPDSPPAAVAATNPDTPPPQQPEPHNQPTMDVTVSPNEPTAAHQHYGNQTICFDDVQTRIV